MTAQAVEAVFFFRWEKAVRQGTYGRLVTKDGTADATRYTKNYIQVSGRAGLVMDDLYPGALRGRHNPPQKVDITFAWPGETGPGKLAAHSGEDWRIDLSWPTRADVPKPWKLGPLGAPETTIPGDPSQDTEVDADRALDDVLQHDLRPWLLAVKVQNDLHLHTRAYLENTRPFPQLAHADVGFLPSALLQAIKDLPSNEQSGVYVPAGAGDPPPAARAAKIVARIEAALQKDPNVLLVGPPGTGKTVALEDLRAITEHASTTLMFDPDRWHDAFVEGSDPGKVISLVFHPSYTYEDFVAGLVPESDTQGLKLVARPGPLISLAHWCSQSDRRALLILDEFNRGPTAAIFGDTLALLDESKRHDPPTQQGAHISRPHADSPMKVAAEFADESGNQDVAPELRLPMNVRIVAALNSSDRSVAPLDAAMRRRFAILSVEPDLEVLAQHLGISLPTGVFTPTADPDAASDDEVRELAVRLLDVLNQRIRFVLGDDFLLGHALLWPLGGLGGPELRDALCHAFDERIVATLRLFFVDQDDLLAAVLGAGQPGGGASLSGVASWVDPPTAVDAVSAPRLVTRRLSELAWKDAAAALLVCLLG